MDLKMMGFPSSESPFPGVHVSFRVCILKYILYIRISEDPFECHISK